MSSEFTKRHLYEEQNLLIRNLQKKGFKNKEQNSKIGNLLKRKHLKI